MPKSNPFPTRNDWSTYPGQNQYKGGYTQGNPSYPGGNNANPNMGVNNNMMMNTMSQMMSGISTALSQGLHANYNVKDRVKTFTGEGKGAYSDYMTWRESFMKQMMYLTNVNKTQAEILQEMKNTLGGAALKAIGSLELTDSNLQVAIELLDDIYMDAFLIVDSLIQKMFTITAMNENSTIEQWWQFYAEITSVRQRFQQLDLTDAEISTVFFQHAIARKLSPTMQKAWRKKRTIFQQSQPRGQFTCIPLDLFYKTILQEIKATQTVQQNKNEKNNEKWTSNKPQYYQNKYKTDFKNIKGLTYAVGRESPNSIQCHTCEDKQPHSLNTCKKLKNISVKERWTKLKGKRICAGCQDPLDKITHKGKDCHIKCGKCGRGHHIMFHDEEFYKKFFKTKDTNKTGVANATTVEFETQNQQLGSRND